MPALLGLVCGLTTMAHIALFARMNWPTPKEPLGFLRDHPPHTTTSRTLAGVSHEQLQGALTGWVARVVADQEVNASVDGKWAKQSEDANGNPLVMVNVLAHDLKLCLAQWPASEKRYEPGVLREQLGQLFERYPGLRLLTMDALYAERDLCQAIVSYGRDYLNSSQGEMYIRGATKIGLVEPVKPSHPYLENGPAPLLDLHYLRISPWLWFSYDVDVLVTATSESPSALTQDVGLSERRPRGPSPRSAGCYPGSRPVGGTGGSGAGVSGVAYSVAGAVPYLSGCSCKRSANLNGTE